MLAKISIVRKITKEGNESVEVDCHGHFSDGANLGGIRTNSSRGDGAVEKIGVGGTSLCR